MRLLLFSLVVASLALSDALPGPEPLFDWPAYPDLSGPDLVNPAGYALLPDLRFDLGLSWTDTSLNGPDRALLSFPGGGFSGWWSDDESMRRFNLGFGLDLFEGHAAAGVGYSWFDPMVSTSPWTGKKAWQLGYILRPSEWLSIGMVRHSGASLHTGDIDAVYRAGIALRPLADRLTLTCNYSPETDDRDRELTGGAELRLRPGLSIAAEAGEGFFRTGLFADFGHLGIAGTGALDDDGEVTGGRGLVRMTSLPRGNLLRGGRRFIRFTPGELGEQRRRQFFGPVEPCFTDRMMLLERIADDQSVEGVILDITGGVGNYAQAEELRSSLERMRSRGKQIYVFLEYGGNSQYYVSSLARRVFLHPCGDIAFLGVSQFGLFVRDLLDDLGIYPDLLHIGRYKSASDMLTRSDMSDAQREATRALIDAFQDELIRGVSSGRGLEPAQLRLAMENGPHSAPRAETAGLVDEIAHSDEVEDLVEADLGREISIESLEAYAAHIPPPDRWGPEKHVAVIVCTGMIVQGESGTLFPFGSSMGSETIIDLIEAASSDPGVAALVLRIDSGGGDALASEDMLHALYRAREKIPVVVSMGGVAASGGYAMACGADRIFADRMTITGSIGIITGKLVTEGMLDSLGINVEEVAGAARSGMGSSFRRYTEDERERQMELLQDGYDLFVGRVAEGRGMTYEQVDSIGRGRVWSGADALRLGLVDETGGVIDAIRGAARLGGVDSHPLPPVRIYPQPGFPGRLDMSLGGLGMEMLDVLTTDGPLYLMAPMVIE